MSGYPANVRQLQAAIVRHNQVSARNPLRTEMPVRLDLRSDFAEIYAHLADLVRGFDPAGGNVLGDPGPVKMVEVGFEYSQAGWLVIVFDTRANAEPDGEWTSLIEGNELERPH